MNQLLKRFVFFLLAALLVFSCASFAAMTPPAPVPESDKIITQQNALEAYLSAHSTKSASGLPVYPAGYAGYYLQPEGNTLILCMTDAADADSAGLRSIASQQGIPVMIVTYSMNDLTRFMDAVGHWEELDIASCGIDTIRNCIVVAIVNLDAEKAEKFHKLVSDSPVYVLESINGYIQPTDTAATSKSFSTALKGTTIYEKPDATSKVLLKAEAGAMFILGKSPHAEWAYVKDIRRQIVGYVKAGDLTALTVPKEGWMEAGMVSLCRDAVLYAQPKASRKLGTLCRGTRVNLMGEIKEYYVVWVGTSEKVLAGYIKKQEPILAGGQVVNSYSSKSVKDAPNGLTVLVGPDEAVYPAVGTLKNGDSVSFVKETGAYTQILFTDAKGYYNTGFVKSANLFYPFVGKAPVSSTTSADGKFRLDLYLSDGPYRAGKNIDCYATITYLGKGSRVSFWGSSDLVFVYAQGKITNGDDIVENDDDIVISAGDTCSHNIEKNAPMRAELRAGGMWKPGAYTIGAIFDYSLTPNGDRNWKTLQVTTSITVQ